MFETFEHTADLGLRIRASKLETLFDEAGQALFATIVERPRDIEPKSRLDLSLENTDLALLLFDWLNELLFRYETERIVFGKFAVEINGSQFHGTAWGESLDAEKHGLNHEVKAITYHGLRVEQ